jgi:hypothetical protein
MVPPRTLTALPGLRQKGNGEGRPASDMHTLSSHTSSPQPEPRKNPVLTVNDAPPKTVLTVNDA